MREATARDDRPRRGHEVRLEPYRIKVPDPIVKEIDDLVEATSARTGETPEQVRRGVEVSVLCRGIDALKREEGRR